MTLDKDTLTQIEETRAEHEFLTFLVLTSGEVKVGIIQNETQKTIMFYDFEKIRDTQQRRLFLQFGDNWWWGSNQALPVDSFIGENFDVFHSALLGYPKKSIDEIHGPTISLQEQYLKRVKKKKIEIVNSHGTTVNSKPTVNILE
jgi:hypothetical protein